MPTKQPLESMSKAEFARRHDCTQPYIAQLVAKGTLRLDENGRVPILAGDRAMKSRPRAAAKRKAAEAGTEDISEVNLRLRENQARKMAAAASREELKLREESGTLVRRAAVVEDAARTFARVRQQLRTLAPRISVVLAGAELTAPEIEKLIAREVNEALKILHASAFDEPPDPDTEEAAP